MKQMHLGGRYTAQELLDKLNAAKVDMKWRSDGKYVPKIVDNPKSENHGACVLQCMDCEQDLSPNIHDSVLSHSRRCTGDLRKRKADEAMDLTADSPEKRAMLVAGGLLPRARVARVKRAMMMQMMSQMMTPIPSHRQVQVHGSIGDETTS